MIYVDAGGNDSFTKLLIHGDQSPGLVDSSASAHAITANASAAVTTAQSKFGGASVALGADGNYIYLADSEDWNFGANPFVVDCWLRYSSVPAGAPDAAIDNLAWWSQSGAGATLNRIIFGFDGTNVQIYINSSGAGGALIADYSAAHGMVNNQWYHWAMIRNGSTFRITKDGVALALTATVAIGATAMPNVADIFVIGGLGTAGPGWVDEFRVSKGTDRGWTSNFSPYGASYD